jgi:hypothetical protein
LQRFSTWWTKRRVTTPLRPLVVGNIGQRHAVPLPIIKLNHSIIGVELRLNVRCSFLCPQEWTSNNMRTRKILTDEFATLSCLPTAHVIKRKIYTTLQQCLCISGCLPMT